MEPDLILVTQIAGIALGSVLLLSVAWVWVRKQVMGVGGLGMSAIGMVLISLTLWQSIELRVSRDGVEVGLIRELEQRLTETEGTLEETRRDVARVETRNVALNSTVSELREITVLQNRAYEALRQELDDKNLIDQQRLTQSDLQQRLRDLQVIEQP
ncbi:MAG: hypothetical protein AAF290_14045 [Pseudomonadota bacterium]